jgi:hypothetical protein
MFYASRRADGERLAAPTIGGVATLVLITAAILGFVTAITMVGPLLLDLARSDRPASWPRSATCTRHSGAAWPWAG